MKRILLVVVVICNTLFMVNAQTESKILPSNFSPENDAFAKGVSAGFSGIIDGKLILAGGSNFPDVPAIEGGMKRYYQEIYVAEIPTDSVVMWERVGQLLQPAAYGVSVSAPDGIICAGGINAAKRLSDVFRIRLVDGSARIDSLPSLPFTLDNMTGTLLGNVFYVAGGNKDGKASSTFTCLDLDNLPAGWRKLPDLPGSPRIQPVCAAQKNRKGEMELYLWGGFSLPADGAVATMSVDGYIYSPSADQWSPLLPPVDKEGEPVSLGGGVATAVGDSLILCLGGVHKDIFMLGFRQPASCYMAHSPEWYQFNNRLLLYNTRSRQWKEMVRTSNIARAGAALVSDGKDFFCINGELKPGIRTPGVTRFRLFE